MVQNAHLFVEKQVFNLLLLYYDNTFLTIYSFAEENITPLEHLSDFLRRTSQEVGSDEDLLQEEELSDDNLSEEDSDCKEFELCITTESSSEEEDPADK